MKYSLLLVLLLSACTVEPQTTLKLVVKTIVVRIRNEVGSIPTWPANFATIAQC